MTLTERAGFRYLGQHPWLTVLSVLGIALGVTVVVSIDVANSSARRSFELSAERVTGRATHSIAGAETVSDDLFRRLRVELGIRPAAPIVDGYASIQGRTFEVLGIDPFFDRPFRGYASSVSQIDLGAFLGSDGVVLLSEDGARDLGVEAGDTLTAEAAGRSRELVVGGIMRSESERGSEALMNLVVADIGTAQQLFDMEGRLSRIDLILGDDEESVARIESALPSGVQLVSAGARTETMRQMTRAFEINLTALSLLALIVGMFLIYNTMTFSVVQRRPLIGRLRAIGVTKREIFRLIVFEAFALGVVGTTIGVAGGVALSLGLVRLVTQTINDLWYVVDVRSVSVNPWIIAKGVALGIGATVFAALSPAREAATAPVAVVLQRSEEEVRLRGALPKLALLAAATASAAAALITFSGQSLTLSYAGLFLILVAFALSTPLALSAFARAVRPAAGAAFGILGRMASRGIIHNLSRTSVAAAALSIAVAAAVGVGIMIGSFRDTVVSWLDYTLQADLYVQAPSPVFRLGNTLLEEDLTSTFASIEGIEAVSFIRHLDLTVDGERVQLAAIAAGPKRKAGFLFASGKEDEIWHRFDNGAVIVSEPFAFRTNIGRGDTLYLSTDRGRLGYPVAGVFYDYGSDQGLAMMSYEIFSNSFEAEGLSGISLYLSKDADLGRVAADVRNAAGSRELIVRSNRDLRELSLEVFDRSFAITAVLRLLALVVAFVGVVSALMALQIERDREFAVLRAEGLTPGQLWRYVTLQTGMMGTAAGLLSVPLGILLAVILVFVINKRSFGWTLELQVEPSVLIQALLLSIAASIFAGIYPSYKMSRANPADALGGE